MRGKGEGSGEQGQRSQQQRPGRQRVPVFLVEVKDLDRRCFVELTATWLSGALQSLQTAQAPLDTIDITVARGTTRHYRNHSHHSHY